MNEWVSRQTEGGLGASCVLKAVRLDQNSFFCHVSNENKLFVCNLETEEFFTEIQQLQFDVE